MRSSEPLVCVPQIKSATKFSNSSPIDSPTFPDTSFFIAELPEATRNIIRKDLEEHAREHHYRLEWDRESKDYVAMSRRFCDMENIYTDTYLHFCETGEDIEPYEKSLKRTISIRLYQDEVEELCRKSGKVGLSIGSLV